MLRITGDVEGKLLFTLAYGELSVACGCSNADVSACGERDSFSIVSDSLTDAEGCYLDTASDVKDNPAYTVSGVADSGQISMVAIDTTGEDASSSTVVSKLVFSGLKSGCEKRVLDPHANQPLSTPLRTNPGENATDARGTGLHLLCSTWRVCCTCMQTD